MNRRDFIRSTSLLAAGTLVPVRTQGAVLWVCVAVGVVVVGTITYIVYRTSKNLDKPRCADCNALISPADLDCPRCGEPIIRDCQNPHCHRPPGRHLPRGAYYCPYCGQRTDRPMPGEQTRLEHRSAGTDWSSIEVPRVQWYDPKLTIHRHLPEGAVIVATLPTQPGAQFRLANA